MGRIKKKICSAIRYCTDADFRFDYNAGKGRYAYLADKEYLERLFRIRMGTQLDLEDPKTFNEKLQWLKLYNRKPEYTMMVDKQGSRIHSADPGGGIPDSPAGCMG